MKATDLPIIHPRILLVGEFGQGKTYFCGMLHELYKFAGTKGMYLYDFDGGFPTLTTAGFDVELGDGPLVDKNTRNPLAWAKFSNDTEKFLKDNQGFGILGIDSLTTVQAAAMNKVIQINPLDKRRVMGTVSLTTQNDFGVLVGVMTQFFPQLINLSEHMAAVLTCHIRLETPTDGDGKPIGPPKWYPAISGRSLPTQIGLYFNEVWMLKSMGYGSGAVRKVQTAKDDKISLKTQIAGMPFEMSPEEAIIRLAHGYKILKDDKLKEYMKLLKLENLKLT